VCVPVEHATGYTEDMVPSTTTPRKNKALSSKLEKRRVENDARNARVWKILIE